MIDLTKDSKFIKRLTGIELHDNAGQKYLFKAIVQSQGAFNGYLGEPESAKSSEDDREPRYVRITDGLVLIPVDLLQEFEANLLEERKNRKGAA